ncbi:MAG: hypothetical protein M1825_002212 [Sarcosagium campestre]|nr:MAG: hypothetical protein M1825_002212 [Sarcosagium campestre]
MSGTGTKVTNDPSAKETSEGAGPVLSDSLAAESTRSGGEFSENRGAEPLGVSSKSSTANTTDTSNATKLDAAPDAEARKDQEDERVNDDIKGPGGSKYAERLGGQGEFSGAHSDHGYAGDPTSTRPAGQTEKLTAGESSTERYQGESTRGAVNTTGRSGDDSGSTPQNVDVAPGYIHKNFLEQKPKGTNLQEGGFESDDTKNASFNSEIGSEQDPGRAAENKFQRRAAESGPDAGGSGPRQKNITGDTHYDSLGSEEQI